MRVPHHGALCGYVGVGEDHPYFGKSYEDDDFDLDVHGGVTFADACDEGGRICHLARTGEPDKIWWFGFDCAHYQDLTPGMDSKIRSLIGDTYRDVEYVKSEIQSLASQLEKAV